MMCWMQRTDGLSEAPENPCSSVSIGGFIFAAVLICVNLRNLRTVLSLWLRMQDQFVAVGVAAHERERRA